MTGLAIRRADWRARGHAAWWAFAVHRASGLLLSLFLPVHFLVLGSALNGAAALDATLEWTETPWVKAGEVVLVFLLAAHLGGGLRLLFVEFGGFRAEWQPSLIAVATGGATLFALLFALNLT
jgi:fumarate reductase subunit D